MSAAGCSRLQLGDANWIIYYQVVDNEPHKRWLYILLWETPGNGRIYLFFIAENAFYFAVADQTLRWRTNFLVVQMNDINEPFCSPPQVAMG